MKLTILALCLIISGLPHQTNGQRASRKRLARRNELSSDGAGIVQIRASLSGGELTALSIEGGGRHLDNIALTGSSTEFPQACQSYEQRYAPYKSSAIDGKTLGAGNQQNINAKYVVILQMHRIADQLKEDLLMAIRALARETQSSGFHFYILFQVPTTMSGESTGQTWNHEQALSLLPNDFRDVVLMHDSKEEYELYYPKIGQNSRSDTLWGPGARAPHAGITVFMQRYKNYDFAYVLEYDVRLTSHWGRFLASALQTAIQAKGTIVEGLDGREIDSVTNQVPEGSIQGLPDLIAFESIWESDKWLKSQVGYDFNMLEEMKAMVYGGSRRLFDMMHEAASDGRNIYIESLLPALSRLIPGGKRVVIKIPTQGESFHCNSKDGLQLYQKFLNSQPGQCMPNYLIHPVKNEESWWSPIS